MMQRFYKHIALLFSLYIFCFGCGINLFNYCCNACADHGSSNFYFVDWETVHQTIECESGHSCSHSSSEVLESEPNYNNVFCFSLPIDGDHCSLERLELPTTKMVVQQILHVELPLLYQLVIPDFQFDSIASPIPFYNNTSPPIPWSGRDLLNRHSVLLI